MFHCRSVAFDHSSRLLLTGTMDKSIRVYDIANPESILETYAGHSGAIKRSLFCKNDKWIVSCAEDKSIKIWDRTAGNKEVMNIDFPSNPSNIEISHDGLYTTHQFTENIRTITISISGSILIVTYGNTVGFYELETMNQIKEIECPTKLAAASLHPDKDGELIYFSKLEQIILIFKLDKFQYSFVLAKISKSTSSTFSLELKSNHSKVTLVLFTRSSLVLMV